MEKCVIIDLGKGLHNLQKEINLFLVSSGFKFNVCEKQISLDMGKGMPFYLCIIINRKAWYFIF